MSSFDKVIGYKSIKRELLQIRDVIQNWAVYTNMGAHLPRGPLLYGDPGLGKTLLAKCFMEEAGLNTVTAYQDSCTRATKVSRSFLDKPCYRVDDLEDEVKFLKVMVRQMAERVSTLEKVI